jgi:uncharacterized protein (DUF1501 family)
VVDPDISAAEARSLLSLPDDAPATWTRRRFLSAIAYGVTGSLVAGSLADLIAPGALPGHGGAARAASAPGGILVVILMYGGNDGANTVVPIADGAYYDQRGALAIAPDAVLPLDGSFGLNPALPTLKAHWDAGRLAIVHGVGYPNPDLSHFTSMGIWMSGRVGSPPSTGWLGRWLDLQPGGDDALLAATVSTSVPLHLVGAQRRGSAVPPWGIDFGAGSDPADLRLYDGLRALSAQPAGRGPWHDLVATTVRRQLDLATTVSPVFSDDLPDSEIVRKLVIAARLVNAGIGLRVVDVGWGDFDSHANQPWMHTERMRELDEGIARFYATLDPTWHDRVTIMTMSEFGRTPYANDSAGTDHGTASCQLLLGSSVVGGMYGEPPVLTGLGRWERPAHTVDVRSYYATVLEGCLGGGAAEVVGGGFPSLGCFGG